MTNDSGEPAPSAERGYWRRNAQALAVGTMLTNIGWNSAFAFLPLAVLAMGVERNVELWVGAMMFGYYAVSCAFTPVWGVLADYYGRKSMVLRAAFGMAVGFALLSMMSNPLAFLIVITLTGLANGFVPASQALVATSTPRHYTGGALALTQTGAWTGTLFGPLAGAAMVALLPSYHSLFLFSAGVILVAGLLALTLVHEYHVRPLHALRIDLRADIQRLWVVPELKLLYYLSSLFAFTVFGAMPIVSLFTLELLKSQQAESSLAAETWVGIALTGFTIASVAVLPVWGRILDRYQPERVLPVLLAGAFASSLLVLPVRDPVELTVARALFALFVSGLPPALIQMVRDRAPKGMEARTLSYGTAVQQIGSAAAPLVAGTLTALIGLRGFFALASAMILLGLVLWLRRARA